MQSYTDSTHSYEMSHTHHNLSSRRNLEKLLQPFGLGSCVRCLCVCVCGVCIRYHYENTNIPYLVRNAVKICRCCSERASERDAMRSQCTCTGNIHLKVTPPTAGGRGCEHANDWYMQTKYDLRHTISFPHLVCRSCVCVLRHYARRTAAFGRESGRLEANLHR